MTPSERLQRKRVTQANHAETYAWAQRLRNDVRDALEKQKECGERQYQTADQEQRANHLSEVLRQLREGPRNGVFEETQYLEGHDGLWDTERSLRALEAELFQLDADMARWPTPDTKHPYEYIGRPGTASLDGVQLVPGDIVMLTEGQLLAWKERFKAAPDASAPPAETQTVTLPELARAVSAMSANR